MKYKNNYNFSVRHIGPSKLEIKDMLKSLDVKDIDELINKIIPKNIRNYNLYLGDNTLNEINVLKSLKTIINKNEIFKSYIGMGYNSTYTPTVIQRNILENPGWYTQYTPYQAEISQGRLEALLNFQTMITDLVGLPISNASLLDEGTAAAEAMVMFYNSTKDHARKTFIVSKECHPQTIEVLKTRAKPLNIKIKLVNIDNTSLNNSIFGSLIQYPNSNGEIVNYTDFCSKARSMNIYTCFATDLLALAILKTPGEMGAHCAVGNSQRFGIPLGFGGPHAAFFAASNEFKRRVPGRIIGVSKDINGNNALRMALQTREQHIRREKATSNICTSQALLAIMASMYAVYHGPKKIKKIATNIFCLTNIIRSSLLKKGLKVENKLFFDTLTFKPKNKWHAAAKKKKINFREYKNGNVGISVNETTNHNDVLEILEIFETDLNNEFLCIIPEELKRKSSFLTHHVFNEYHSETKILRYMHDLETKDLSLNNSMIPLGSCTMKLNATTEMIPVSWPEISNIHPFSPSSQTTGYMEMISQLENWLSEITGFNGCSMQPNSGAQGEYSGLLVIKAFHKKNNQSHRNICLIPSSAHGTNPASAVMAGMKVVIIKCDKHGNIDIEDLKIKTDEHSNNISAIMITYPSTHGVFEDTIQEACKIIHSHGGQVYIDGANLNALVGLCKPGSFGGDIMHINLHKTFCIPHGGGGPGMGPIVCKGHLKPFLPGHLYSKNNEDSTSAVSSTPYGSSSILTISWVYIAMMGEKGLKKASQIAILNANYMAKRLENDFEILFRSKSGFNAHEFIVDLRNIKSEIGISEEDIAKRLMDYGFHAPTMSWPVVGTMMFEPTESESKSEIDRFCDAMISIKNEINDIKNKKLNVKDSLLKNAPHTAKYVSSDDWNHTYKRSKAAFPAKWQKNNKYWPSVGRIDNTYGDRNLICVCPPIEDYID